MSIMLDTPFRVDGAGGIAYTPMLARQIAVRLGQLLVTSRGERAMRPEYGTNARDALFEPTSIVGLMLQTDLQSMISRLEPDIQLVGVTAVTPTGPNADSTVMLQVGYTIPQLPDVVFVATITAAGEVTEVVERGDDA